MISGLIVVGLLLLSAFFSGSEIALMGVPMYKIQRYLRQYPKSKLIHYLINLRTHTDKTLITILIGNNLVNVIFSIYADRISEGALSYFALTGFIGSMIVVSSVTFMLLLFGEIMPKAFASKFALQLALQVSPIIKVLQRALIWIVWPLEKLIKRLNSLFAQEDNHVSRDDVEIFVEEGEKQGIFSPVESMIVRNLMVFRETSVEAVFKHRTEIFALSDSLRVEQAIKQVLQKPYTRIPIYHNDKDHIIGMITLRDLLDITQDGENFTKTLNQFPLKTVAKVPVTASIFHMFTEMKMHGRHMAIVIDEYGGTAGLVTLEDILEMMVGDIKDESDQYEEQELFIINATKLIAKGDVILRDILHHFKITHLELPPDLEHEIDEESMLSTIILERLKEFAEQGDKVHLGQLELEVYALAGSGEKIEKIKVTHFPHKTKELIQEKEHAHIVD